MDIAERERATYAEMHTLDAYRAYSPGAEWVDLFASLATPGSSVLDAGCGAGAGLQALESKGFRVFGCDLTIDALPESRWPQAATANLWRARDLEAVAYLAKVGGVIPGDRFDYVYCCDVLEHIPPPFVMLVIRNLLDVASRGVFLSISLVPDQCGAWVGKALHQTVQRFEVWRDQVQELGTVTDARDLGAVGIYWVEPR